MRHASHCSIHFAGTLLTAWALTSLASALPSFPQLQPSSNAESRVSVLVQAGDVAVASAAVRRAGGRVTHELGIINGVAAQLDAAGLERLRRWPGVERVLPNGPVRLAMGQGGGVGSNRPDTQYPVLVGADELHSLGITGAGVTVAVVDTGFFFQRELTKNTANHPRLLAHYNALDDQDEPIDDRRRNASSDRHGHASHVTGVLLSSGKGMESGRFQGIAPDADLVSVQAFDTEGRGRYADVIRGLDWILANASHYGIRVVNLSFSAAPRSFYWDDPLNQAVMALWQAGVVVVTSAGNSGPGAMTIGVPGNVPYVLTVGAMTDNYTPGDPADDRLASFSAAGPTWEGFVKPEIVAPGGHLLSLMPPMSTLAEEHPELWREGNFFTMSGTSQAAAVVSGVAALLLQAQPWLGPDDVKCRLMAEANPAIDPGGGLAYSPFQQGAGLVDALGALSGATFDCANQGLDIDLDLAGTTHYAGPARQTEEGIYHILGGHLWDGSYVPGAGNPWTEGDTWIGGNPWTEGDTWTEGNPWTEGDTWTEGNPWTEGDAWTEGNPWTEGDAWTEGNPWTEGDAWIFEAAINHWVDHE